MRCSAWEDRKLILTSRNLRNSPFGGRLRIALDWLRLAKLAVLGEFRKFDLLILYRPISSRPHRPIALCPAPNRAEKRYERDDLLIEITMSQSGLKSRPIAFDFWARRNRSFQHVDVQQVLFFFLQKHSEPFRSIQGRTRACELLVALSHLVEKTFREHFRWSPFPLRIERFRRFEPEFQARSIVNNYWRLITISWFLWFFLDHFG